MGKTSLAEAVKRILLVMAVSASVLQPNVSGALRVKCRMNRKALLSALLSAKSMWSGILTGL